MGTGYYNEIRIEVTGNIEEDVGTRNTQLFKKELELLCLKYDLNISDAYSWN